MLAKKSSEELLLISCTSSDPFSTLIIDISSGSAVWGLKGHEFRSGNGCQDIFPLGIEGDYMICTENEGKWLHIISTNSKNRFHQVSHLNEPLENMIINSEGSIVFASSGCKLYVWQIFNGSLLAMFDDHYQKITRIKLSSDNSLLFTSSADGNVHVYNVTDLYNYYKSSNTKPTPLFEYRPHSLSITDMTITKGGNPRIITCSEDHSLAIYSMSQQKIILKITADKPLKSCDIDGAESRLFIGNDIGNIAIIDLYNIGDSSEKLIVTSGDKVTIPILEGHDCSITSIAVNTDGSILATGDINGGYRIWDIASRQTIKTSTMKSGIRILKFVPNWKSLHSSDYVLPKRKFSYFQRVLSDPSGIIGALPDTSTNDISLITKERLDEIFEHYYDSAINSYNEVKNQVSGEDSDTVKALKKEIERLQNEIKILADSI
uniref:WD_REPEATS_REGION domain-containing protein n=1 Tax=Strongyloides stercoralis TaxID=6248 RepID=A0A0K0E3L2_STRER